MQGRRVLWKIENFSFMKCGTISTCDLGWEITINPFTSSEYISIELKRINVVSYAHSNCALAILDSEGSPLLWREKVNISQSEIIIQFNDIKKDTIFGSTRDKFLPNGNLIVQWIGWGTREELLNPVSVYYRSQIILEVVKETFIWNIKSVELYLVELFTSEGDPKLSTSRLDDLTIRLFLGESLRVRLSPSLTRALLVKCIISVLDAKGKIIQFLDEEHNFDENEIDEDWTLDTSITKGMLLYYRKEFLPNDTLSLLFSCTFGTDEIRHCELKGQEVIFFDNSQSNVALPLIPNNNISRALMSILEEGLLSDFNFRVQHKTFPVHKAILSGRSSVFKAMFTVDMKEKESGSVNIQDVEADTFQKMLEFIYSDSFEEDMQWESVSKLYSVADKYDLEPLKQKCSQQLKSELCVTNVLEVLLLGDTHRDDDLKAAVVNFIAKDSKKFVASDRWRKFAEENLQLAFDTLQMLFVKKVDI